MPVSQPGELRNILAANHAESASFKVLYTPRQGKECDHFEAVNRLVQKCGRMVYAVDEVDKNQEPGWAPPNFYELLNYGRHCKVAMIGTSRRTAQVSKEYTSSLSEVCAFRFTEPGDLKYFEAKCGGEAVRILPTLQKYGYLRWLERGWLTTGKGWGNAGT